MKTFLVTVQLTPEISSLTDWTHLIEYIRARSATAAVNTVMRKHGVSFAYNATAYVWKEEEREKDAQGVPCFLEGATFYRYTYRLPRGAVVQS